MKTLIFITLFLAFAPASPAQQLVPNTTEIRQEWMDAHNAARREVGVPDLQWSDALAESAGRWAMSLAASGRFEHSEDTDNGENLFWSNYRVTPRETVESWVSEKELYNDEVISIRNYHGIGHYTQIVWHSTKEVGCAIARLKRESYVVCHYQEPGNYLGEKPY